MALAALATCAAPGSQARSAEPRIAYESDREIKLIAPDGTGRQVLTRPSARTDAFGPAWSPSGETLAFLRQTAFDDESDTPEVSRVVAVDLATGASRTIASNAGFGGIAFAPDGASVVYAADVAVGDERTNALWAVGADGTGARALTRPGANDTDYAPAWSPDGATVAFTRATASQDRARVEIWAVPAAGGPPRRLVADAAEPDWSPDGRRIAFTTTRDRNGTTCFHDCSDNREIYVADADGSNVRRLTFTKTDEGSPAWSPDGTQIAFHDARPRPEGNAELFAMREDGSCVTRLTNTSVSNHSPEWRPRGAHSAPLSCDGAVPGAAAPLFETDLAAVTRFRDFPLAWLGESYDGALLSAHDVGGFVTLIYDDCGRVGEACPLEGMQVQTASICSRHPLKYGGYGGPGEPDMAPHARRYRRVGDALVADYGSDPDIYTGRISVTLFGASFERAVEIARDLTVFPSARSALAAPRFHSRTLARVRAVNRELRRLGMRELSRRWRMSREQIRAAVKLRGVLSGAELRRGTARCG